MLWNTMRAHRKGLILVIVLIFIFVLMAYDFEGTETRLHNATLLELQSKLDGASGKKFNVVASNASLNQQSNEQQLNHHPWQEAKQSIALDYESPYEVHIPTPVMYRRYVGLDDQINTSLSLDKVSQDDRFRYEILDIYNSIHLPESCDDIDNSPPRTVSSQREYNGCLKPRVPNIIHLVWLYGTNNTMSFRQLLSALSMLKYIQPCVIFIWSDGHAPSGDYWHYFLRNVTTGNVPLRMFNITVPSRIWGRTIAYKEHRTDIIRFEVLKHFGGIYMDLDVLILKSIRPLRCYDYTLGREDSIRLTASLVLSVPNAPFLLKIIQNYKNYRRKWAYNSVEYPHELARKFPELIHVEDNSINHPSWHTGELKAIFDDSCILNLSKNYALHLWNSLSKNKNKVEDPESIRTMSSTFGQIARLIYYGDSGPCKIR